MRRMSIPFFLHDPSCLRTKEKWTDACSVINHCFDAFCSAKRVNESSLEQLQVGACLSKLQPAARNVTFECLCHFERCRNCLLQITMQCRNQCRGLFCCRCQGLLTRSKRDSLSSSLLSLAIAPFFILLCFFLCPQKHKCCL